MALDDPQDFARGLENERQNLADSEAVHDSDRTQIKRWLRQKDGQLAVSSLKTYLRRVRVASERSDQPLVDLDETGYHDLIFSLRHEHDLADSTVQSYENAILPFLNDMTDADWTGDVDRTSVERSGPTVDEILTPADVQALIGAAGHQRDVAFIDFLADTGARLSLALSLRVGDVEVSGDVATYTPNEEALGLKGAAVTEYPLIDSVGSIRNYLRGSHPRPSDPDVALFHKVKPYRRTSSEDPWGDDDGGLRANAARQQLYRIADRAGVEKPTNPHAFRHTAITRMVREGYTRSQIEHRVHWELDTDMWEIYEHITSDEHNRDIFREAGVLEEADGPDRVRKQCGQCQEAIAPHHEYCPRCGTAVTADADDEVQSARETIRTDMAESESPSQRRDLSTVLSALDEREDLAHRDNDPS